MLKSIFVSILFASLPIFVGSQITSVIGKSSYPFLVSAPSGLEKEEKAPLLIFLHGRSLSGTDL